MRGLRAIDWFVPDGIRARGPEALRRGRTAVATCGIATLLFSASALYEAAFGDRALGVGAAVMVPLFAGLPLLLRATGSHGVAAHAPPLLLLAFSMAVLLSSGGLATGGLFGAASAPIVAALLGGARPGILWGGISCAGLAGTGLLVAAQALPVGPLLPQGSGASFRAALFFTLGTLAVVLLYESLLRRARAERRASEARFRALTEEASDVVSEWDTEGFVRYVSPRVEEVTGTVPADFVDTHWLEHVGRIHPEDVESFGEALEHVVGGNTDVDVAMRFRHSDGSWRWFEFGLRPFRTAEGELRVVSVARDVTDRREIEALRSRESGRRR